MTLVYLSFLDDVSQNQTRAPADRLLNKTDNVSTDAVSPVSDKQFSEVRRGKQVRRSGFKAMQPHGIFHLLIPTSDISRQWRIQNFRMDGLEKLDLRKSTVPRMFPLAALSCLVNKSCYKIMKNFRTM